MSLFTTTILTPVTCCAYIPVFILRKSFTGMNILFADVKRMTSPKLITSCVKRTLHAIIIWRLRDNVRGKWRRRKGKEREK